MKIPQDLVSSQRTQLIPEYVTIVCSDGCPQGLTATMTPVYNSVGKVTSFTIAFNQPIPTTKNYWLRYYTNALDNGDGAAYRNNVTFTYDEGSPVTHSVSNTIFGGGATGEQAAIKVLKVDENDQAINGATFKLEKRNASGAWEEVSTKPIEFGQAYFAGLLIGNYRLIETEFPTNYTVGSYTSSITGATQDGATYYFDIKQSDLSTTGKSIEIKVSNALKRASLEITKFDADQSSVPLQGAVFELVNNDDPTIKYTLTTGSNGVVTETDIIPGTYTLTETQAPAGYLLNASNSKVITFEAGDAVTEQITNQKAGELVVTKVDEDGVTVLPGAEFTLTNGTDTYVKTTDSDGLALFEDIKPGTYTLTETKAPAGYERSTETKTFTFSAAAEYEHTYTMMNKKRLGMLQIQKIDERADVNDLKPEHLLKDVQFKIVKPNGEEITALTDDLGIITLNNLPQGKYTISEVQPKAGYEDNATPFEITIGHNDEYPEMVAKTPGQTAYQHFIQVSNVLKPILTLTKTDLDTGNPLEGVLFDIEMFDGTEWKAVKEDLPTDVNGKIEWTGSRGVDGPEYGTYHFVEKQPLPDYKPLNEPVSEVNSQPITLAKETPEYNVLVANEKLGKFELTKYNANNTSVLISGAKFKLEKLKPGTTDEYELIDDNLVTVNGKIAKANLERGQYKLTETNAAPGYYLNATPIDFTVEYDAATPENMALTGGTSLEHKFNFSNRPINYYPPVDPTDPGDSTDPTDPPNVTPPTPGVDPDDGPNNPTTPTTPPTPTRPTTPVTPPATPSQPSLPPGVQDKMDELEGSMEEYPARPLTYSELEDLYDLYQEYLNMTEAQKREFEKRFDVAKMLQILKAEGYILPQTGNASTTPFMLGGMLMLGLSLLLIGARTRTRKE